MLLRRLRQSHTGKAVLFWLIPALLLSLGLRVCLHAPDATNPDQADAAAIHLENDLASTADLDDADNGHVSPAFAPFKFGKLADVFAFAAVLTATLLLFLSRETTRVFAPAWTIPALSHGHRFRPPLRAPPR